MLHLILFEETIINGRSSRFKGIRLIGSKYIFATQNVMLIRFDYLACAMLSQTNPHSLLKVKI